MKQHKEHPPSLMQDGQNFHYNRQELLEQLGLCDCGQPDECLKLIKSFIDLVEEKKHVNWDNKEQVTGYEQKENELFLNNIHLFPFFLGYLLNHKDIFEHGGSVPGWLLDNEFKEKLDGVCFCIDILQKLGKDFKETKND